MNETLALTVLPLVALLVISIAFRRRRRFELEARLLDVLGPAVRRGIGLAPLVARLSAEAKPRQRSALGRMADALLGGAPLSVAAGGVLPRHTLAAVQAAEGTAALAPTLAACADDSARAQRFGHRLWVVLFYPAALCVMLVATQPFMLWTVEIQQALETDVGGSLARAALAAVAFLPWIAVAAVAVWWIGRYRWGGARWRSAERVLRAVAPLVAAGVALPDALRRCAGVGHAAWRRAGARVADELESGVGVAEALRYAPLPESFASRAAAAARRAPDEFARALQGLADEAGRLHAARVDKLLAWLPACIVLVVALVAAARFAALIQLETGLGPDVGLW